MQKTIVTLEFARPEQSNLPWLDLGALCRVDLSSDDSPYLVDEGLEARASGWRAAAPGEQTIEVHFDAPQPIEEIQLRFEVRECRTQEFVIVFSCDGGISYRELVRQQFNFSPSTPLENELYRPQLRGVTDLRLIVLPDISHGTSRATLHAFRIR